jgi:hypothetical protein
MESTSHISCSPSKITASASDRNHRLTGLVLQKPQSYPKNLKKGN